MTEARYLIVNADDFGRSPGVNRGIMSAYEHGIVTSASLMVRWPAAAEAAKQLGVPLRECSADIQYCGRFYGQTAKGHAYPEWISVDALISLLAELPPGITEIGCHPGEGQDLDTVYLTEREEEMKV